MGFSPKPAGMSELGHQIRNYSNFTWLNGSFLLDWLIHDIDICCWIKDAWPVSAQGQGGRQVRTEPDQLFDHYAVEYSFADGTRMFLQGRQIAGCWEFLRQRDRWCKRLGRLAMGGASAARSTRGTSGPAKT